MKRAILFAILFLGAVATQPCKAQKYKVNKKSKIVIHKGGVVPNERTTFLDPMVEIPQKTAHSTDLLTRLNVTERDVRETQDQGFATTSSAKSEDRLQTYVNNIDKLVGFVGDQKGRFTLLIRNDFKRLNQVMDGKDVQKKAKALTELTEKADTILQQMGIQRDDQ